MPSSFTPLLKLELPATGELSGTWGTTVNNAITTPLSEAVAGTTTITVGGSDYTLSNGDGSAANEARKMFIVATGTPGASRNVICPAASKFYVFRNDTNQTLTLKTLSGTGIAVPAGQYRFLYCNGTDVVETFNAMASLTLGTALGTASGGTGLNSFTANRVFYASSTSAIAQSANLTFNGTTLVANDFTDSSLTATRVTYAGAGGNLTDSANLTFDGTSLTLGGNPTLSAGTANGVLYLNGSKVATSGSALTFDGSFLSSPYIKVGSIDDGGRITVSGSAGFSGTGFSIYETSSGNAARTRFYQSAGLFVTDAVYSAGSNALAWSINTAEQMRLTSTGLGIGTTPSYRLDVNGTSRFSGAIGVGNAPAVYGGQIEIYTNSNSPNDGIWVRNDSNGASSKAGIVLNAAGNSWRMAMGSIVNNSNALTWDLDVSAPSTLMTLTTSGNLGLGVTPSAHLPSGFGGPMFQVGNRASLLGSSVFSTLANNVYYASGFYRYIASDTASMLEQSAGAFRWYTAPSGTAGNAISFTQAMTLDASGNLGVGTTSPTSGFRLDVQAATARQRIESTTGTNEVHQRYVNTGGTFYAGLDNSTGGGFGAAYGAVLWHTGNYPMVFATNDTERARITSGGDLLVGTTDAAQTSGAGVKVGGAGGIGVGQVAIVDPDSTNTTVTYRLYSTGAAAYRFYVGLGGTVYATSATITSLSDQRLKENIQNIDVGLDAVMALKPRKFDWKAGKGKDKKNDRGFIAQEFEQVFPEMIDTWRDPAPEGEEPYKAVNADLIPVLVKAIQEQQALIAALTARVAALETH